MKTSDAVAMTVDEALTHADEWVKGQTFYPGAQGWRVVCAVLAAEVRRLRAGDQSYVDTIEDLHDEIGRLREALQTAKAMGFFSPTMESSVTHRDLCKSVNKILEQAK